MMNKHTPGPWRVGVCGSTAGRNFSLLAKKKNGWVNILKSNNFHDSNTRATTEEAEANARLIAAAPTMYEYIASSASNGCAEARKIMEAINAGR